MRTIRWGIVGCGDVTEVKSGPGFQKADNSALVAVMRRDGALAEDYARRHGVPKWYDDAEALVRDPEVDAVYVATPPYAHKEYALLCAEVGKPVYVEKPMAMNYEECQAMIEACRLAGVPLFVAYYRRALPRFLKVKELLEDKAIGEVRAVIVRLYKRVPPLDAQNLHWHYRPEIGGGGKFVDMGCHTLDFLDYVLGPIRSVCGFAANQGSHYPAEDIVTGAFEFDSGVHGIGVWCFTSFNEFDETEILGSQGKIAFSSFDTQPISLTTDEGVIQYPIGDPPHVHQPLTQTVVDELNGIGTCPSTGESAARTTWIMDQLLDEYRNT